MSLITRMRRQKAVWWERSGVDKFGKPSFEAPCEIDCRWEDTAEEHITPLGEKFVSRSLVYVDRVMSVGDYLRLGELVYEVLDNPFDMGDAYEIKNFMKLPNIRNTETLLTAVF